MILIRNISMPVDMTAAELKKAAAAKLRVPEGRIRSLRLEKKSLDARKKPDLKYICSVSVSLDGSEKQLLSRSKSPDITAFEEYCYEIPSVTATDARPVIAGFGPAGMFAALVLARAGARPVVIERGQDVDTRTAAVEAFRSGGNLDPECNVQFGEGGAGTFSDGKLNTGTHDARIKFVLSEFHSHGAQESILYDAKPHIGTDVLTGVVKNIREEIISLGGEVRFGTRLERPEISGGVLCGVHVVSRGEESFIPCSSLILAIGHSARDTFETLHSMNIPMERKAFSMGVRIEHSQDMIDNAQYGRSRGSLPAADYSLAVHLPDGTSAYTFCMCPGGHVFAAASEEGRVCTNGMSYSRRDGRNANSAVLVTLHPEDFPGDGILAGMQWQREIESAAYNYGGGSYLAPAQLVGDFLAGKASEGPRAVQPTYTPGVVWGSMDEVLPEKICSVLRNALPEFGRKLKGFDSPDSVLTGPETRSSSPVRILRDKSFSSEIKGLYPCGEGAGYAGGITSAAVDGMRCAEAVIKTLL